MRSPLAVPLSLQVFAWVGDFSPQCAGGNGQRAGEVNLGLLVPHAAGKVAVGGADATQRGVETAERVARAAATGGTQGPTERGPVGVQHVLQPLTVQLDVRQSRGNLAGAE